MTEQNDQNDSEGSIFDASAFPDDVPGDSLPQTSPQGASAPRIATEINTQSGSTLEQLTQEFVASGAMTETAYIPPDPASERAISRTYIDAAVEMRLGKDSSLTRIVQKAANTAADIVRPLRIDLSDIARNQAQKRQQNNSAEANADLDRAIVSLYGSSSGVANSQRLLQSVADALPKQMKDANADSPTYQNISAQLGGGKGLYQQLDEITEQGTQVLGRLDVTRTRLANITAELQRASTQAKEYEMNAGTGAPNTGLPAQEILYRQIALGKRLRNQEDITARRLNNDLARINNRRKGLNNCIAAKEAEIYALLGDANNQDMQSSMFEALGYERAGNNQRAQTHEKIARRQREASLTGLVIAGEGARAKESFTRISSMQSPAAQLDASVVLPDYRAANAVSKMQTYEAAEEFRKSLYEV